MGAQVSPAGRSYVSRALARRLDQLVMKMGKKEAAAKLGVSPETLETAIEEGRLLTSTVQRITTALDRMGST